VILFADFHRLPGDTPNIDTNLKPDEIITAVELPAKGFATNYSYLKIRDRLSYAFALVSIAAALELDGGTIKEVRLGLGGVAHKPWRNTAAEAALRGRPADQQAFAQIEGKSAESENLIHMLCVGELSLDGRVRAIAPERPCPRQRSPKRGTGCTSSRHCWRRRVDSSDRVVPVRDPMTSAARFGKAAKAIW